MTANPHRVRWIIADPDTGAVLAPEFAVAIDLDRLTAEQIDAATDASELDLIPADVLDESVSLAALLADGLRWRAWLATPYNADATRGDSWQTPATVPCASCWLAGDGYKAVDVRAAVVVPWDVMGDPRAYALACPECAEVDRCNTCGGSGRWETTFENSPTTLTYLGACPECAEVTPPQCSNCGNEWGDIAPMDDEPSSLLYCTDCRNEYDAAEVNE